ncbi:MAG: outer membrane protein transport protein [Phycisphaerae bacterium]|nr:outer membrane protein transport protein [Phycisphaerae bacterium]
MQAIRRPTSIARSPARRSPERGLRLNASAVAAIMLLCCGQQAARATDGLYPIGVSTQAQARGGADVAVGDSAISQVDNPATLSLWPRTKYRFDFTSEAGILPGHWRGPAGSADDQRLFGALANVGLAMPLDETFTLGLALHTKAGTSALYYNRHLMIPYMKRRVSGDLKIVDPQLNLGIKITDKLSVGAGARFEVASGEISTVLGPADVDFGRGYAYGGGFQLGMHYRARKDLSFGLGYTSPTWYGDLSGDNLKASLFGILPIDLGKAFMDEFRMPQKLTAGVAWDATDWLRLHGEVRWINWDKSSFHSTTIATDGLIDIRYPFPLGYQDQLAFIAGAEFKLNERWTLGTGYHFGTEPVDPANLLPVASTLPQHHVTLGLRYHRDNWWVGGGYILSLPISVSGPGCSDILLGVDYGCSEVWQAQHGFSLGFGFSW